MIHVGKFGQTMRCEKNSQFSGTSNMRLTLSLNSYATVPTIDFRVPGIVAAASLSKNQSCYGNTVAGSSTISGLLLLILSPAILGQHGRSSCQAML